ncbi:MAG: VanZ family protein [Geobacteraceae bacterium]|nr:VanZ family protein [Geobacteraceae bacterium]
MLPLKMRSGTTPAVTLLRLLLLAAYAAVILWLSLVPSPPSPPSFLGWDKLQHGGAFAVFALLAGWAFTPLATGSRRKWSWVMAAAMVCGALIEILQGLFTETRTAELGDLVADAVGAGIVCLIMALRGRE